jgi:hypothetical protein
LINSNIAFFGLPRRFGGNHLGGANLKKKSSLTDQQWSVITRQPLQECVVPSDNRVHQPIQSSAFEIVSAKKKFLKPTKLVNELWQTDFTQFNELDWGWYYLTS